MLSIVSIEIHSENIVAREINFLLHIKMNIIQKIISGFQPEKTQFATLLIFQILWQCFAGVGLPSPLIWKG